MLAQGAYRQSPIVKDLKKNFEHERLLFVAIVIGKLTQLIYRFDETAQLSVVVKHQFLRLIG